jgi:hypothetical protein
MKTYEVHVTVRVRVQTERGRYVAMEMAECVVDTLMNNEHYIEDFLGNQKFDEEAKIDVVNSYMPPVIIAEEGSA